MHDESGPGQSLGMSPLIPPNWVSASARWSWKTDFAMSRPIVVTSMTSSSGSGSLNSSYIRGTHVPVGEPSTASKGDVGVFRPEDCARSRYSV
jgi:hypothetical protein